MLISGAREELCLDFANTLMWRGSRPAETLASIDDVLGFLERSAGIGGAALGGVRTWLRDHPRKAAGVFSDAIVLRESIFGIFSAIARGTAVPERDFAVLKGAVAAAPARRDIGRQDGRFAWRIDALRPTVPHLLAPVLWSAADLMLEAERRRIRRCANEKCLWLFIDASKSGTRRWCDMNACGNRAKAHRHYSKLKKQKP